MKKRKENSNDIIINGIGDVTLLFQINVKDQDEIRSREG